MIMTDIARCFVIWGVIVFFSAALSFCAYRWLSRVARFENRKKEIAAGFCVCVLTVASLLFLPIFFLEIDLNSLGTQLSDSMESLTFDEQNIGKLLVPFIELFVRFLAVLPLKYIRLIIIGVSSVISTVIIGLIVVILFKIREPKNRQKNEYNRKHLFEYNREIVNNLNRKK